MHTYSFPILLKKILSKKSFLFAFAVFAFASLGFIYSYSYSASAAGSNYSETVALPNCSSTDATVKFIKSNADWADLNNPAYKIFCVQPGDYTGAGNILVKRSGTALVPLYIRYYDPANPADTTTHPVTMASAKRATLYTIQLSAANYVIIDRLALSGGSVKQKVVFLSGSSHNILNRLLIEGGGSGSGQVAVQGSSYNVIQNNVIRSSITMPNTDIHGMRIDNTSLHNRVVGNEIYDLGGDAIQLGEGEQSGNIIAYNDLYATSKMYTDCKGNRDPNGHCSCSENGLDFKGYAVQGDPVIIDGNRIWGYREVDIKCSSTGSKATAINFANRGGNKSYILFKNNIVWDSTRGFAMPGGEGANHISFIGNLFYNIHNPMVDSEKQYILYTDWNPGSSFALDPSYVAKDGLTTAVEMYYNTIVNVQNGGLWMRNNIPNSEVKCNVIINGGGASLSDTSSSADYNAYYNTTSVTKPGTHDYVGTTDSTSLNANYCFTYKKLSGPVQLCIPYAKTTTTSPHAALCKSAQAGAVKNIGIDDNISTQAAAGFLGGEEVSPSTPPTSEAKLSVLGINISGDFTQTNNCTSLKSGESCSINVSFVPKSAGVKSGVITLTDSAIGSPRSVGLVGLGIAPATEDKTAPTVVFVSPSDGQKVSGTVALKAEAADANGVQSVAFYIDSELFTTVKTVPYAISLDSLGFPNGTHKLTAKAVDGAGNAASASISITVANATTGETASSTPPSTSTDSSTQEETMSLVPVADAMVNSSVDALNSNFGTGVSLEARGNGVPRESFLRFDLSKVPGEIVKAQLQLALKSTQNNVAQKNQLLFVASDTWMETGVTWNTKPASGDTLATWTTPAVGTMKSIDVTAQAKKESTGDKRLSLRLISLGDSTLYFSREGVMPPKLLVTYKNPMYATTSVPVPVIRYETKTFTFKPVADTYVNAQEPDGAYYGKMNRMEIRKDGVERRGYLKFDLSSLPTVSGAKVSGATLKLTTRIQATDAKQSGLYLAANDTWKEDTVTWNSQPGNSGDLLASWNVPTNESSAAVSITEAAQKEYMGDKVLSLELVSLDKNVQYYSREAGESQQPVLTIDMQVPVISSAPAERKGGVVGNFLKSIFKPFIAIAQAIKGSILAAVATAVETVNISPAALDFGSQVVGTQGAPRTITITYTAQ